MSVTDAMRAQYSNSVFNVGMETVNCHGNDMMHDYVLMYSVLFFLKAIYVVCPPCYLQHMLSLEVGMT